MDIDSKTSLLGGLSAAAFMKRHWHRKPLLVRAAVELPRAAPPASRARAGRGLSPVSRSELFELASREDVESRLVVHEGRRWRMRTGPLPRAALPRLAQPQWTLLVQGVDLHVPAARELLERFRFVPDARLDDLMVSYATEGGGVGPHLDSYDVFLLQVQGRRRWRYGPARDTTLVEGVPLKLLRHFEPEEEQVLEPGDMLYLPPGYAHDGVAVDGECMTCSIGFRAPSRGELAREVLQRTLDAFEPEAHDLLYRDPSQPATAHPGAIPPALQRFAADAVARLLRETGDFEVALGEVLSEPKSHVWFEPGAPWSPGEGVRLAARSIMLHDAGHIYLNGESFAARGRDLALMRTLSDERRLSARDLARLSSPARDLLQEWLEAGWLVPEPGFEREGDGR